MALNLPGPPPIRPGLSLAFPRKGMANPGARCFRAEPGAATQNGHGEGNRQKTGKTYASLAARVRKVRSHEMPWPGGNLDGEATG